MDQEALSPGHKYIRQSEFCFSRRLMLTGRPSVTSLCNPDDAVDRRF